jgi:hypothetical protein
MEVIVMKKTQTVRCDWCGIFFKKLSCELHEHNFCSIAHFRQWNLGRMRQYNATDNAMNQPGGVISSRIKRGNLLRGSGEGRAYTKRLGRHEHRIVAEEMLGRSLKKYEVVHHIDGDKKNNHPSNLLVLPSQREHAALHSGSKGW